MPDSIVDEAKGPSVVGLHDESDQEQHACNGVTTPQQSTSEIKHMDNSIFNTISKIVNPAAKVRIHNCF